MPVEAEVLKAARVKGLSAAWPRNEAAERPAKPIQCGVSAEVMPMPAWISRRPARGV